MVFAAATTGAGATAAAGRTTVSALAAGMGFAFSLGLLARLAGHYCAGHKQDDCETRENGGDARHDLTPELGWSAVGANHTRVIFDSIVIGAIVVRSPTRN